MISTRPLLAGLVLLATIHGQPRAQSPAAPRGDQTYVSGATAILVDVVVRDRNGRPVTDLSAEDFEIAEDGVIQKVDSFTRVTRGGGIGVGVAWRAPAGTGADPRGEEASGSAGAEAEEATTALVFDHLSAESLRLAQRATLAYVPMTGESSMRVGVFATGPGTRILQRFTTDRALVRRAVARVLPVGTGGEERKVERTDELLARRRALEGESESAAARAGTGSGAVLARNAAELGERETELRLVQTELNMIRAFDTMDRDHRGYDTALALLEVVQTLSSYPGRKSVVFFSEGLPVSPVLAARLDYVIDAANRGNVTTYAVDAHGLRALSTSEPMRKEIQTFGEDRLRQLATGNDRTDQPLTMAFERVEDTMTIDSRTGLARLAEETGGFLVEGSNDLGAAFRRIDEDNRFHYLLTYAPSNTDFDGGFRRIQVKVRRPGAQVFARKGYRAVRSLPGGGRGSYEAPALALLDRARLPRAFPMHAAGFSFPDPDRPGLTSLVVQVRTDVLRLDVDPRRATYAGQTAIVVRIRDREGQEVQTLSQQYLLAGDAKDLDAARRGEILFYREVDLAPGIYTVEAIVFDAAARQGSARVSTLTVPPAEPSALGMSSLVLVARAEEVSDAPAAAGPPAAPLYVGRTLLYPNLGVPVRKSASPELPFYFTLYGRLRGVQAAADLLRNGQALAHAPVELPAADGPRLQHVGRIAIGALSPGTYELRIRAVAGSRQVARSAFFTIE